MSASTSDDSADHGAGNGAENIAGNGADNRADNRADNGADNGAGNGAELDRCAQLRPAGNKVATWGILGTGAVAGALATRLAAQGHIVLIHGRDAAAARRVAARAGSRAAAVTDPLQLAGARAMVLAVSDAALEDVARELARGLDARGLAAPHGAGAPRVVLHTSGAHGREVLGALEDLGLATGSVHPLVALAPGSTGAAFEAAWFALDGPPVALHAARALVAALRGPAARALPHTVTDGAAAPAVTRSSGELGGGELVLGAARDAKLRYHAAASLVSGGVVALLALAEAELVRAGAPLEDARAALAALAASAVANTGAAGPSAALTGAAARGDELLVRRHLGALGPRASAAYSALLPCMRALAEARRGPEAQA
ncbi:MAG: DUF2520 domain-containing protein [Planctomycetota bacterium]